MRPTLFHIPPEVLGIPLFGFGLLLWITLAITLLMVFRAFAQHRSEDAWSDLLLGGVVSALLVWVAPGISDHEGFPIRGYGLFLMMALILSSLVLFKLGKKRGLGPNTLLPIIVIQVICGLVGARIFYLIEYWNLIQSDTISKTVVNALNITRGGLVVYGSIIGGILATVVYTRMKKLPILRILDLFAPALMLGIAIGRLGCFMNGCCFGGPCDLPIGVQFPPGSPAHYAQIEEGIVSLGGFSIAPPAEEPESTDRPSTLFHVKNVKPRLRSALPGPVIIESVQEGTEAAAAGLTPGMRILRVGLIPSLGNHPDDPVSALPTENEIQKTPVYPIRSNDDLLSFILYESGALFSHPILIFDVEEPTAESSTEEATSEKKVLRLAFHAGPFEVHPVHPTQLYSTGSMLALFFLLLILSRYLHKDGELFAVMLAFYATVRFLLEMIRTDELSFLGTGLSVSQTISILIFLTAVILFLYARKSSPRGNEEKSRLPRKDKGGSE